MPARTALKAWLILAGVLAASVLALLPTADSLGANYVDEALRRALVGFALARGLNGVISVAQGTELAVQPAGVGVNFTPGEILDPVNDLVERFSWIMMLAASSLGIQKVLLTMSGWQGLLIGLLAVGALLMASYWLRTNPELRRVLGRVFLLLLLLRFMMPAIAIANDWVFRTFLAEDYDAATASLDEARDRIGSINDEVLVSPDAGESGMIDRAREMYRQMVASIDIQQRLDEYRAAAESISENTIRLIVVFLMQTLVFPLLFLWLVFALMRRLFRPM